MRCASLRQRGGSLKHLPKHPPKQKSSSFSASDIARDTGAMKGGNWSSSQCKGRRAEAERLSKEAGPLKWLFYLIKRAVLLYVINHVSTFSGEGQFVICNKNGEIYQMWTFYNGMTLKLSRYC
jgi:hypothetical protein